MDRTSIDDVVANNAREQIVWQVQDLMERIRSGEPQADKRRNPFAKTGTALEFFTIPGQGFANSVIERGLHRDDQFMAALHEALESTAYGTMFNFFSAIDGEGHWEGTRVFLRGVGTDEGTLELHGALAKAWAARGTDGI